ncbi:MAG: DsrE family protein [Gammaproteobacteria bacterium]|nr:DsrE family protein [Gammaproteobacteria bacterium]MDH3407196.1 DsrE family protein [Gammaproteobacteria bacterium]MDH3562202.1 DsrE family protein [Gammaproteobacteria bacterium]MDH5487679.1 DsrE family protein [Gammaproteobacteria bacterium]
MKAFIRLTVFPAALLLAGMLPLAGNTAVAAEAVPMAKVVWHVDFTDPRRLSAMIQNVNNMVTTYQNKLEDYDIRIVFLAGGIRFVTEDPLKGTPFEEDADLKQRRTDLILRLQQLRELHGVKLELCEITREVLNLAKTKIIPGVASVRSGVVRIAELQHQGFAYLKIE